MSTTSTSPRAGGVADLAGWEGPVIDVDVHITIKASGDLFPYMPSGWVEWLRIRSVQEPPTLRTMYPPGAPTTVRDEWRPSDGRLPASDLSLLREQLLDPTGAQLAIIHPYWGLEGLRQPELAQVLARAINDWMIEEWLSKDSRLRGTLTVPHHDPAAAIAEIKRIGGHPQIVQVGLPVWSQLLWGKRLWHPMFAEIAAHDLVAGVHYGGAPDGAPTASGWPAYHVEQHGAAPHMFFSQLVSLIGEGVFSAVPDLRMSFLESGFSWIPTTLWRLNKEWKGLRHDVPWITRPPADIIREHIRVSVQPFDGVPARDLERLMDWLRCEEMLMYASDYPHGHDDDTFVSHTAGWPLELRRKIMADNAREHYRL